MTYAVKQCAFCGSEIRHGTGTMYVRNDGSIQWFCSAKCRKSLLVLRRDPRKLKWTAKYRRGPETR